MESSVKQLVSEARRLIMETPPTDLNEAQQRIKVLANAIVGVAKAVEDLEQKIPIIRQANLGS